MNNSERRKRLGAAIRRAHDERGISQRELARMMGYSSHSQLNNIENGRQSVGFDKLCAIADALDIQVSYFFTEL